MKVVKYQGQNHIIKIQLKGDYCKQHDRYKTGKFAINMTINNDTWTLLDLKTGYGLPIGFSNEGECLKKTIKGKVYGLSYNDYISGVKKIGKKIEKTNDFIYTCK